MCKSQAWFILGHLKYVLYRRIVWIDLMLSNIENTFYAQNLFLMPLQTLLMAISFSSLRDLS